MSAKSKNLSQHGKLSFPDAGKYRIGILVSEYNEAITFALRDGALEILAKFGVKQKNIVCEYVPGAFELPLAAKWMYDKGGCDAVIILGCVIKGETTHDIYINTAVSQAVMQLGIETGAPFVFGVITPSNTQQAKDRAGGRHGNKGVECAIAALKMLSLKKRLKRSRSR